MDEERASQGYPAWHLEHQCPSVWICRRHRSWLKQSSVKKKGRLYQEWLLPDDVPDTQWEEAPNAAFPSYALLLRMAEMTAALLATDHGHLDPAQLRYTYLAGVKRMGMLGVKGAVRLREVCDHVLARAKGLESLPGFEFVDRVQEADGGFVGGLLRSPRGHKHPVKHLILMATLFENWGDFWETYCAMAGDQKSNRQDFQPRIWEEDPRREQLPLMMLVPNETVSNAARRLGVPVAVALYWARIDGIPYRRRPRSIHPDMDERLRAILVEGPPIREAAREMGVPCAAVSNYLNSHDEVKKYWEAARQARIREIYRANLRQFLEARPGTTRTQLRVLPGTGYKWLYQHDREWLMVNLPSLWSPHPDRS